MKKYYKTVLVLIVILIFLTHISNANAQPELKHGRVALFGVTSDTGEGVPGYIEHFLLKGSGKIYYRENLDIATKEKNKIAINYVSSTLGLDPRKFDYYITYGFNTQKISGVSGSASLAILLYSTMANLPINDTVAISGNIDEHGNILEVSGILNKVIESSKHNITTYYIPKGQRYEYVYVKHDSLRDENGFLAIGPYFSYELIDIINYSKENFNIDVIEIDTITHLVDLYYYSNINNINN
ncbi:hypothetical protein HOD20_01325 [archaeon]|nr:hypothetical protein [archaeon]